MNKMLFIIAIVISAVYSFGATGGYDDLEKLVKAGVGEDVIIAFINSSTVPLTLTPDNIAQLKSLGATDKIIAAATRRPADPLTIYIPNASGGYTPVNLVKVDNGYLGPQGELYVGHPTVSQLKALYGK